MASVPLSRPGIREDGKWGQNLDVRETSKVRIVQSKQMADLMNEHCCNEASVVCELSGDVMSGNKPLPFLEHLACFRQKLETRLEVGYFAEQILRCFSATVLRGQASRDHPVFVEDLRNNAKVIAKPKEMSHRTHCNFVVSMRRLDEVEQNIGVEKNHHCSRSE